MPITGLYFLPTTSSSTSTVGPGSTPAPTVLPIMTTLTDALLKHPPSGTAPNRIVNWTLSHNLLRSTPSTTSPSTATTSTPAQELRNMQYLHLSYRPNVSYIAISTPPPTTTLASQVGAAPTPTPPLGAGAGTGDKEPTKPDTMIALPHPHGTEDFLSLVQGKMGPLWQHRQTLEIAQGFAFRLPLASPEANTSATTTPEGAGVEEEGKGIGSQGVIIRMGEVRSKTASKGLVVEVELLPVQKPEEAGEHNTAPTMTGEPEHKDNEESEEDWEKGEERIRAVWDALGLKGGRAFVRVAGVGQKRKSGEGAGLDLARQYCEMLRMRV